MNKAALRVGILSVLLPLALLAGCGGRPSQSRFKSFPLGQTRPVDFAVDADVLGEMTDREVLDQARDWLLFAALTASDLSAKEISQSLYDLPAIRRGYLRPVGKFEYGETRSCYYGDGNVVALLPDDKPDARADMLAHIADEQRKNSGELPKAVVVFEYKLKFDRQANQLAAELTRRETLEAKKLFTKDYGYYESKVGGLADLQRFLQQVDGLTFARLDGDSLVLGGRKMKSIKYRGISAEDVAAIWQSESEKQTLESSQDIRVKEFNDRCAGTKRFPSEEEARAWSDRCDQDKAQLEAEMKDASSRLKLRGGLGFSLDPTYDYERLRRYFDEEFAPKARAVLGMPQPSVIKTSAAGRPLSPQQKLGQVSAALAEHQIGSFLKLLEELSARADGASQELAENEGKALNRFGFQSARYDGGLQGTELGMTLFYTDLLAKLWAINYLNSTPQQEIGEFIPLTAVAVSPIYKEEIDELANTRLWFGPQDRGFQVAGSGRSLLFAQNATRVYAASANMFRPDQEGEPNARSAAFLDWWDDHYEEIARYEPEYERLNEIMKWSLLVGWLNKNQKGNLLGSLKSVQVNRSNWFPDWARRRPDLRFRDWGELCPPGQGENTTEGQQKICFYAREGDKPESMPLLQSNTFVAFNQLRHIEGGVTLADDTLFEKRVPVPEEAGINKALRRSNLDYGESLSADGTLRTLEGVKYKLNNPSAESALTVASPKPGAKLRGRYNELANHADMEFERAVYREGANLRVDTRSGFTDIGSLEIDKMDKGLQVSWSGQDVDAGQSLARRLSTSGDLSQTLAADPGVETFIQIPDQQRYLVRLRNSEQWMDVSNATADTNWDARVADTANSTRNLQLSWLDKAAVKDKLGADNYILIPAAADGPPVSRLEVSRAGPPAGAKVNEFQVGDLTTQCQVDAANGSTYFKIKELPEALQHSPEKILLGWRMDARIEINRLPDGSYKVVRGEDPQEVIAPNLPGLLDLMFSYERSPGRENRPLQLELSGFSKDEMTGLVRSMELESAKGEAPSKLTSISHSSRAETNSAFKAMAAEYDFARARVSEPSLSTVKDGTGAGMHELKMSVEIPAKEAVKPSLLMRLRMLFKAALGTPKLREIRAGVRRIFRRATTEEANIDLLALSVAREMRKIHPEIQNIHTHLEKELLDLMISQLTRPKDYDRDYSKDRRAA
ncbi:MAG TPA: hypothetical protein VNI02_08400 [Blastocatellia bacterium]|jgi:hypothetical protein|nr:hypothetical protein [Blastocatellia bacterium]